MGEKEYVKSAKKTGSLLFENAGLLDKLNALCTTSSIARNSSIWGFQWH